MPSDLRSLTAPTIVHLMHGGEVYHPPLAMQVFLDPSDREDPCRATVVDASCKILKEFRPTIDDLITGTPVEPVTARAAAYMEHLTTQYGASLSTVTAITNAFRPPLVAPLADASTSRAARSTGSETASSLPRVNNDAIVSIIIAILLVVILMMVGESGILNGFPSDQKFYRTIMQSELSTLSTAETIYHDEKNSYTANVSKTYYLPYEKTNVTVTDVSPEGYHAHITHQNTDLTCDLVMPASKITCTDGTVMLEPK